MPGLLFITPLQFYPDAAGGAEHCSHYLFQSLRRRGWRIEVICAAAPRALRQRALQRAGREAAASLRPSRFVSDRDLGYRCWRGSEHLDDLREWLDRRLHVFRPDLVLGHYGAIPLLRHAAGQGYPCFYFIRGVDEIERGMRIPDEIRAIAVSPFAVALAVQASGNEVGLVRPFVDRDRYRVDTRERRYITFVNPVPEKGLHVAVEVARRMPEARFVFVKGRWAIYTGDEPFLAPIADLSNVALWDYQWDMRQVYMVTDILLVPSKISDTNPRVIVEAHVNGIPVVAARNGGIPDVLGKGGILVAPKDDPQGYVDALRRLRSDPCMYAELSALALANSQRAEFDPERQVDRFIEFVGFNGSSTRS